MSGHSETQQGESKFEGQTAGPEEASSIRQPCPSETQFVESSVRVIYRGPRETEMLVTSRSRAKGLAAQLVGQGKDFRCSATMNGWTFWINEINEPNTWEHHG